MCVLCVGGVPVLVETMCAQVVCLNVGGGEYECGWCVYGYVGGV